MTLETIRAALMAAAAHVADEALPHVLEAAAHLLVAAEVSR